MLFCSMILEDKHFIKYISNEQIQSAILKLGTEISDMYAAKNPLCIVVLQGAFMFAADLVKHFQYPVEIVFIKIKSYTGTQSGEIIHNENLPDVTNRNVIIIEDIIDTGNTLQYLMKNIKQQSPASVFTIALLQKQIEKPISADRVCFKIADTFVVGYGLDYNEIGRNLKDIWQLAE